MTAKVTTIHGGKLPKEPDIELVATLEELLQEAKAGELTAMAYATVKDDGRVGSGWDGGPGTRHMLGTAVSFLNLRFVQEFMGDDHG